MPYLDIEDRKIFYNDTGQGEPLVLLHNGLYSSQTWDPVRPLLAERYRVIDYDRFGYGRSTHFERRPNTDVLEDGVTELGALIEALGLPRVRIIGHCLGGAIALGFTAAHPRQVQMIVAESVGYYGSLKTRVTADMTFIPFDSLEPALRQTMIAMHGDPYARRLWEVLSSDEQSYIMNEGFDIRGAVSRIKLPLLMVNGDRDFYFEPAHPVSVFKKMRRTAGLWIVPHTGHDIHMERPDLFVEGVARFFDQEK